MQGIIEAALGLGIYAQRVKTGAKFAVQQLKNSLMAGHPVHARKVATANDKFVMCLATRSGACMASMARRDILQFQMDWLKMLR